MLHFVGGVLLLVCASPRPAAAIFGAIDVVPAATLLLPYFEVDLDNEDGATTRFWVRNAGPGPVVAHGVVWTDLGVPTQTFNLVLAGFASVEVDLRDLFADGSLGVPAFGDDCENLDETLGRNSTVDLGKIHTGDESDIYFDGACGGTDHDDRIARGFITIDSASDCTELTPSDNGSGYFQNNGLGVANNENTLWGEFVLADPQRGRSQSEPMVHIEAFDGFNAGTFYYRIFSVSGADNREALPRRAGVRYLHQLTDVVCWRDILSEFPFSCGSDPPAQTLGDDPIFPAFFEVEAEVYDHEGSSDLFTESAVPCNLTSTRTTVGSEIFPVPAKTGWLKIDADPDFGAKLSGFTPSPRRLYLAPIHRVHPKGLSLSTGGVALDPARILLPLSRGEQSGGAP